MSVNTIGLDAGNLQTTYNSVQSWVSQGEAFLASLQQAMAQVNAQPVVAADASVATTSVSSQAQQTQVDVLSTSDDGSAASALPVYSPWQAPWMATMSSASDYLLPADTPPEVLNVNRPDLAAFMSQTGVDFKTANEVLYGVVGSNTDYRDWSRIMQADDPLMAARQATGAMYNSGLAYASSQAFHPAPENILAQAGNLAWVQQPEGRQGIALLDAQGGVLRNLSLNAQDLWATAQSFALDPATFGQLADQLDAQGIAYQPWQVYPGSDYGVDLHAMSSGGIGSSADWRADANLADKAGLAAEVHERERAMADALGLSRLGGVMTEQQDAALASAARSQAASLAGEVRASVTPAVEEVRRQLASATQAAPVAMGQWVAGYNLLQQLMQQANQMQPVGLDSLRSDTI